MKIMSGNSNLPLARAIAAYLEMPLTDASVRRFADEEIFFGSIMEFTDQKVSLLPDFVSNCGIARLFAYLMESKIDLPMSDHSIFEDTSNTIRMALEKTHRLHPYKTNICRTSLESALQQLM